MDFRERFQLWTSLCVQRGRLELVYVLPSDAEEICEAGGCSVLIAHESFEKRGSRLSTAYWCCLHERDSRHVTSRLRPREIRSKRHVRSVTETSGAWWTVHLEREYTYTYTDTRCDSYDSSQ